MAKKTGIGSYPADDPESGRSDKTQDNDGRKKQEPVADPDRVQRNLDRHRNEMAEDAPASNSPEDNP